MTGKKHEHIVKSIMPGSIAEELGIEPGDKLLSIDGQEIEDIFDYQFYVEDEEIVLLIEKQDGEQWELEIEKDADEQLGIEFGQGLMDEYRSCSNHCMFCFFMDGFRHGAANEPHSYNADFHMCHLFFYVFS